MKEIKVTQGFTAFIDDEDYEIISKHKWYILKGHTCNYATTKIRIDGVRKTIKMHRLIMSPPKEKQIDHINHNGLDNRKENLRVCTCSENLMNVRKYRGNSIYKGVSFHIRRKKWNAHIQADGKLKFLGYFLNEIEAAEEYNKAALKYFGEFANINKI